VSGHHPFSMSLHAEAMVFGRKVAQSFDSGTISGEKGLKIGLPVN
jgi:hypothetical protein